MIDAGLVIREMDEGSNYSAGKKGRKKTVIKLSPRFLEIVKDFFIKNDGTSDELILEEMKEIPIDLLVKQISYTFLLDVVKALKFSVIDNPGISEAWIRINLFDMIFRLTRMLNQRIDDELEKELAWETINKIERNLKPFFDEMFEPHNM